MTNDEARSIRPCLKSFPKELAVNQLWVHRKTGGLYIISELAYLEADATRVVIYTQYPAHNQPTDNTFPNWTPKLSEVTD